MKTKILFLLFSSLLMVACAIEPLPTLNPALMNCQAQRPSYCRGNGEAPEISVKLKDGRLGASNDCTLAEPGSVLVFRLFADVSLNLNDAEILPKDPAHVWLAGKNDTFTNLILVQVPKETADGDFGYGIKIGAACLDPRVHVEN